MVTLRRFFPGHDDNDELWALPEIATPTPHIARPEPSLLDRILPRHDFRGVEQVTIDASPREVLDALRSLTLGDLHATTRLARFPAGLMTLFGHANADQTLLDASNAIHLGEIPDRELVIGFVGTLHGPGNQRLVNLPDLFTYTRFNDPAYEKLALSFQILASFNGRTTLVADQRILALSPAARRRFAVSWYLVAGWSGNLMLRQILHATRRRAETRTSPL